MQGRVPATSTAATDGEGRFGLRFPVRYAATLLVEADGFGRQWIQVQEEQKTVEVHLRRGGSLQGRVLTPDGSPASGARVLVLAREAIRLSPDRPLGGLSRDAAELPEGWFESVSDLEGTLPARADREGRFRVDGLEEGVAYHAYAVAPGFAASLPVADLVGPAPGGVVLREFRLREPAALALDLQAPSGIEDGRVEIEVKNGGRQRTLHVDVPGVISLEGIEPGEALIRIEGPSFVHVETSVALTEGERAERVLVLSPGETVAGVVVDDTGAVLAEVPVRIQPATDREGGGWRDARDAMTASDGTFRVPGLPPGPWLLDAGDQGRAVKGIPIPDGVDPLRIVLPRPARVSFRAVLPEGWSGPGEGCVDLGPRLTQETIPEGEAWTYSSEDVAPGRVQLLAWVAGLVPIRRGLDLRPGETRDLGDIPLQRGRTIRGKVLDDRGEPVWHPTVQMLVDPEAWYGNPVASSSEDGSFVLSGVPEGTVRLRTYGDGHETVEVDVVATDQGPVVLQSGRLSSLDIRVEDPAGRSQANVLLTLRRTDGSGEEESDTTGIDGTFGGRLRLPFQSLRAGTWSVLLERHGVRVESEDVLLAPGEARELRLVFP